MRQFTAVACMMLAFATPTFAATPVETQRSTEATTLAPTPQFDVSRIAEAGIAFMNRLYNKCVREGAWDEKKDLVTNQHHCWNEFQSESRDLFSDVVFILGTPTLGTATATPTSVVMPIALTFRDGAAVNVQLIVESAHEGVVSISFNALPAGGVNALAEFIKAIAEKIPHRSPT
ncbi:MAG: hypothetical protein WAX89_02885 [Alphaproteobacteria bacterium]